MGNNYFEKFKEANKNGNYILASYYLKLNRLSKSSDFESKKEIDVLEQSTKQELILQIKDIISKHNNKIYEDYFNDIINKNILDLTEEEAWLASRNKEWENEIKSIIEKYHTISNSSDNGSDKFLTDNFTPRDLIEFYEKGIKKK